VKVYPSDNDWAMVLGYARMRAGDYRRAVDVFRGITEKNPEDVDAHNLLGESLRLDGRLDEAVQALERSVARHPNSQTGWFLLGQSYFEAQRLERAKLAFRESLRLEPEHPQSWLGLAAVLARVGPRDEYDEALKRIMALNPELVDEHRKSLEARAPAR
jgi:cytochrome c-type biogenesis protein CcmH/NrfG